jgi:hypothetical protein
MGAVDQPPGAAGVPKEERTAARPISFVIRALGWIIVGLFGAGSLGAFLRGKPTLLFVIAVVGVAAYRAYAAFQSGISVIPPLICIAVVFLLGGLAKSSGDLYLEDDDKGYSRLKRPPKS